ncbi:MAG: UDP-N-acetylmuramoyl-tripeptide--D-alanyl-D-alanine ligase [Cellulosilyticaceae bacterium]
MELSIQEIIHATGGRCLNKQKNGNILIDSITTDTRQVSKNSLFIPLKGERFDGHNYIKQAFEKGAIATLTEHQVVVDEELVTIWVANTQQALLDLASYYRTKFDIPVIAITGSVGKTTTKDLIASVLGAKFNVLKTEGNFNNEIGMPLTLFKLNKQHEIAVIEMGMNHFNEIHRLSSCAMPNVAVITNIGVSHIENLGSQTGILEAKLEIVDGLKEGGPLIINGDDNLLNTASVSNRTITKCGFGENNSYRAENIKIDGQLTYANVITPLENFEICIPAIGEHMVYNSLVAIAVAQYYNLSKQQILDGLMAYMPSKMRMNIKTYSNNITVLDDAYNASPDSMLAALKVLTHFETEGNRIAILGDMFEMGELGPEYHEKVGTYVAKQKVDILCTVGTLAKNIAVGAEKTLTNRSMQYYHYNTKEQCITALHEWIKPHDTVLLKASRGMAFEEIVEAIGKVNKK